MNTKTTIARELVQDCGFNEETARQFAERNAHLISECRTPVQICDAIVQRERVLQKIGPEDDFPLSQIS